MAYGLTKAEEVEMRRKAGPLRTALEIMDAARGSSVLESEVASTRAKRKVFDQLVEARCLIPKGRSRRRLNDRNYILYKTSRRASFMKFLVASGRISRHDVEGKKRATPEPKTWHERILGEDLFEG